MPLAGAERQCLYFPQGYDDLNLSNGDKRSIRFFRELIKRLRPDIVHFHHLHRIGVESIRAARLAAPEAVLSLTLHDMAAICMADGAMVKRPSPRALPGGKRGRPAASVSRPCQPGVRGLACDASQGRARRLRSFRLSVRIHRLSLCRLGPSGGQMLRCSNGQKISPPVGTRARPAASIRLM